MSTRPRPTTSRRTPGPRPVPAVVAAVLGLALAGAGATTASADPSHAAAAVVEGTLERVIVDAHAHGHADDAAVGAEAPTFVRADGTLYLLPDDVAAGVDPGARVEVSVDVPAGVDADDAQDVLEHLDADPDAALGVEQTSPATTSTGAGAGPVAAAAGSRTLTVLPVHWGSPDGATQASLTALAADTAQYWSEQSAGAVTLVPAARPWARIAAPVGCDTEHIFKAALAANPGVQLADASHVLVYFPRATACGWAGQASVRGRAIWVNGTQARDVAAHEVGHNLGLGHADRAVCTEAGARVPLSATCTTHAYGDYADVMGIGMADRPTGSLNSALAHALGLATVRTADAGPTVVDLAPLGDVAGLRALAVPTSQGTVYVDFRPAVGRDTRWSAWAGVQVHLRRLDANRAPSTVLLDMQPAAASFATPQLGPAGWEVPGTGRTLWVSAMDAGRARVELLPTGVRPGATAAEIEAQAAAVRRYVTRVYSDLFSRDVDPVGLSAWTAALTRGTPRAAVASGITSSAEYRARLIAASYQRYLLRGPDAPGLAGWQGAMSAGWTIAQMQSGFVASDEYYAKAGGTDAGWVRALYAHVLGRAVSDGEVRAWTAALAQGASRQTVAMGFLLSWEHLSTVVGGHYQHLLGRGLDPAGQAGWVGVLQRGGRDEDVIGAVVASEEYFAKV